MSQIRYRKNINCLTTNQLHDFREALTEMYSLSVSDGHSFEKIAGLHGSPSPSYCIHGYPGFLTWHRAYLDAFEQALRCINPDISLPFWNWSSGPTTGVPAACREATYVNRSGSTVDNPLFAGPIPASLGGGMTSRSSSIDTTSFDDIATSAQSALTEATFSGFQSALNNPHGNVHIRVGGNMSSVSRAGFDPIFYLHHANVDRLWAIWQSSHPGALSSNEANLELEPFNKPYSTNWQLGSEVETTDMLGYRYTNFCFILVPWGHLEHLLAFKLESEVVSQFKTARLTLKTDSMPMRSTEFRIFINEDQASIKTATQGNPKFAGTVALFGMGDKMLMTDQRNKGKRFDVSVDISNAIRQQFKNDKNGSELALSVVAVDEDGKAISDENINIKGMELLID